MTTFTRLLCASASPVIDLSLRWTASPSMEDAKVPRSRGALARGSIAVQPARQLTRNFPPHHLFIPHRVDER